MPAGDDATVFEHFVAFCVLSDAQEEDFDVLDVHTGGGGDLGLDGVAILVNGVLVDSTDVIDSLLDTNGYLDVRFIFTQAKTASGFSGDEIAAFGDGVAEFFAETPSYPHSERISELRALMDHIFKLSHAFKHFTPVCDMVFVSTGTWVDDPHLIAVRDKKIAVLRDTSLFSNVSLRVWGAAEVQASWKRSKNTVAVEFTFANKVTLPDIPGVKESYLGVLPLSEFLKVVSDDETKSIRKHIFYDNVRDFQGDNAVNGEMASSLQTGPGRDRFAVLNNGVTLIARTFRNTGNKFFAADFQIVNGCQTSHVLFNNRDSLDDTLPVPFKVIATADEEVISSIVTATNRQTEVSEEDLFALENFQKKLEAYFASFPEKQRLHYERRSRQYNAVAGIEKVRIITKQLEIRVFGAMFANEPHLAARYYGELKAMVGRGIFNDDHKPSPYYTAAFAYYKLEFFFRNGQIPVSYKPARFHLLLALRYGVAGRDMPAFTANKIDAYSRKIDDVLWSDAKALDAFKVACAAIDLAAGDDALTRDLVKAQGFTDKVLAAL